MSLTSRALDLLHALDLFQATCKSIDKPLDSRSKCLNRFASNKLVNMCFCSTVFASDLSVLLIQHLSMDPDVSVVVASVISGVMN
jgi:hypothetical protein